MLCTIYFFIFSEEYILFYLCIRYIIRHMILHTPLWNRSIPSSRTMKQDHLWNLQYTTYGREPRKWRHRIKTFKFHNFVILWRIFVKPSLICFSHFSAFIKTNLNQSCDLRINRFHGVLMFSTCNDDIVFIDVEWKMRIMKEMRWCVRTYVHVYNVIRTACNQQNEGMQKKEIRKENFCFEICEVYSWMYWSSSLISNRKVNEEGYCDCYS